MIPITGLSGSHSIVYGPFCWVWHKAAKTNLLYEYCMIGGYYRWNKTRLLLSSLFCLLSDFSFFFILGGCWGFARGSVFPSNFALKGDLTLKLFFRVQISLCRLNFFKIDYASSAKLIDRDWKHATENIELMHTHYCTHACSLLYMIVLRYMITVPQVRRRNTEIVSRVFPCRKYNIIVL